MAITLYISIRYTPQVVELFARRQELKAFIESKGFWGVLVFILFQILQVVVAAIPGEAVQLAGGYIYGTLLGTLYLTAGVIIGSIAVFFVSRLLGYGLVRVFVSEKKLEQFSFLFNSKKSEILMFLLFLVPGLPKDLLTYIAGITPVKPSRFLAIAVVGRLPALFVSSYIGANFQKENYTVAIIASVAAVVLFSAGLVFKDKLMKLLHVTASAEKPRLEEDK